MNIERTTFDSNRIEAEENLLIDFQFLIQQILDEKGMTRSEVAKKAGISKARLSQILGAEANPTVKTFARLFYALGENIIPVRDGSSSLQPAIVDSGAAAGDWKLAPESAGETSKSRQERDKTAQLADIIKESIAASNDNRDVQVVRMEIDTVFLNAA